MGTWSMVRFRLNYYTNRFVVIRYMVRKKYHKNMKERKNFVLSNFRVFVINLF